MALPLTNRFRKITTLVVLAACGVGAFHQIKNIHRVARGMWLGPPPASVHQPFKQARGNRWALGHMTAIDRGSLSCWEAYDVTMSSKLRADLKTEDYLEHPNTGTAERMGWSPNRMKFSVNTTQANRLIINQNWHPGWHASRGVVKSHDGLLSVDLPKGRHHITLRFLPRSAFVGTALSLSALILLFIYRVTVSRLWMLLPPLIALLVFLAIDEPAMPAPISRNANGAPVIAKTLPQHVQRTTRSLHPSISLAGIFAKRNELSDKQLDVEAFIRIRGDVGHDLEFMVIAIGPHGEHGEQTHQAIGASYATWSAPKNALLRDAFTLNFDRALSKGSWKVLYGVRRMGESRRPDRVLETEIQ